MRKIVLFLLLLCVPVSLLAQDPDWRNRRPSRDRSGYAANMFEPTPFIGYVALIAALERLRGLAQGDDPERQDR